MRRWIAAVVGALVVERAIEFAAGVGVIAFAGAGPLAAQALGVHPALIAAGLAVYALIVGLWFIIARDRQRRLDAMSHRIDEHLDAHAVMNETVAEQVSERVADAVTPRVVTVIGTIVQQALTPPPISARRDMRYAMSLSPFTLLQCPQSSCRFST